MDSNDLERVFLRVINAETDEQFTDILSRALVPVLCALKDPGYATKIAELLEHINKRLYHRTEVQLPFFRLVELIQDGQQCAFTMNMGILYTKKAYERLSLAERLSALDSLLKCVQGKPKPQVDILLSGVLTTLPHLVIPNYPDKQRAILPCLETKEVAEKLFPFALNMVLLPYGAMEEGADLALQPGISKETIERVLKNSGISVTELELAKKALLSIISCDIFSVKPHKVVAVLAIATADVRSSVSDLAETHMKKLRNSVDWEQLDVVTLLYGLFVGTAKLNQTMKQFSHNGPAGSLRLRMKLLPYLSQSNMAANLFPLNIQVIFGALFGEDTNRQIRISAAQFAHHICDKGKDSVLATAGPMLKTGLTKIVQAAENKDYKLCGLVYLALGKLSTRCPALFSADINLLSLLFTMLEEENRELLEHLKEGLSLMSKAYKLVIGTPTEAVLETLLLKYINKPASPACVVALRFSNALHPSTHLPSRFLCLLALGSSSDEVKEEARAGLSTDSVLPDFHEAVRYICKHTAERLKSPDLCYVMGTQRLPYLPHVYTEVLNFVRRCLEVGVTEEAQTREKVAIFSAVLSAQLETTNDKANSSDISIRLCEHGVTSPHSEAHPPLSVVKLYGELICGALVSAGTGDLHRVAMEDLLTLVAALPRTLASTITLEWCQPFLFSSTPQLRASSATLLGVLVRCNEESNKWSAALLSKLNDKQASYEQLDGAMLAAGYIGPVCEERVQKTLLAAVLDKLSGEMEESVCHSLYQSGCQSDLHSLLGLETLQGLQNKLITRILQCKDVKTLSTLCSTLAALHVYSTELPIEPALNTILNTSKLGQVELQFNVGTSLALMSSGPFSEMSKCPYYVMINDAMQSEGTEHTVMSLILTKIVREYVLGDVRDCQGQAASVWLLSLLKFSITHPGIQAHRTDIQHALSILLASKDSITQEIASEALALLYEGSDSGDQEKLIGMLRDSLLSDAVPHKHLSSDTKIFSEEDIGKIPKAAGGGSLTTYKELCSLASDMNQPEMIYQFMHLSNHSAIWSDKVGAAFGVGSLMKAAGKQLEPFLFKIVPRLYRYQFDPNPKVQQSMSNIWSMVVTKPKETVDQYFDEILKDIKDNIHHRLWRTREACCSAMADLIRTRSADKRVIATLPELWLLIFKVMDDIKESVRVCAVKSSQTLSKISISVCNVEHGTQGAQAIGTILPVLLDQGIGSGVEDVQTVATLTVMKISDNAGELLKPHVDVIIPAFVSASATIEPKVLGQVTMQVAGSEDVREKVEEARAQMAILSPLVNIIDKCIRITGDEQLAVLVPKLSSLAKSSVGLTPRVTLLHTVALLAANCQHSLTPYVGKLMAALFVVLGDRSIVVRNKCAGTIATLVRFAKPSTVDNVIEKLTTWYLEKEDGTRELVARLMFNMVNSAPDVIKNVKSEVIPLVMFGRHVAGPEEAERWSNVWVELGVSEQASLTLYLTEIRLFCLKCLESNVWGNRRQAAATLENVALVLSKEYPLEECRKVCEGLVSASTGRVWPGKEAIMSALCTTIVKSPCDLGQLGFTAEGLIQLCMREASRSNNDYIYAVITSFSLLVEHLKVDCWATVWELAHSHLTPKEEEEGEEEVKRKKTFLIESKVQQSCVLLLGSAWQHCESKKESLQPLSDLLAGSIKICVWSSQTFILSSLSKIVSSLEPSWSGDSAAPFINYMLPEVLRCVDDMTHASVRCLALKLLLTTLKVVKKVFVVGLIKPEVVEDIKDHVRDQVGRDSNQALKSVGVEIIKLLEKDYVL